MRVKTSVTIDEDLLRAIDKATTAGRSRSRIIEDAARLYLSARNRAAREDRDLTILNATAAELNLEMEDVLAYQGEV
jgi:metal-responsive CopG/Arc/MetJ family transcriptional regulator